MNLKTILLNAALGILSGLTSIFCMSDMMACCCGIPSVLGISIFVGTMMSTLLTKGRTVALNNTLWGLGHGLFAAALATGTVMVGLDKFTSDEKVVAVTARYREQVEEARKTYREAAAEENDEATEEALEETDKLLANSEELLAEMEDDPDFTRGVIGKSYGLLALLGGFLLGALGGLAGHLTFGKKRTPDGEAPPRGDSDPDRMQMPEQPKQWWED